jgi:hemolysin III
VTEVLVRPRPFRTSVSGAVRVEQVAATTDSVPAWRGLMHEKAFALSPATGLLLFAMAGSPTARIAAVVFAVTMTCMLGASSLNHRVNLGLRWEHRFRRADHIAILLFLGGTWTSMTSIVLSGSPRIVLTAAVWGSVLVASLVMLAWLRVPGWLMAAIALAVAWPPALVVLPQLGGEAGSAALALFVAGGVVYTIGAMGYALRRPNLHPAFGYHEVFHALVLGGVACHYVTLAVFVLPLAA